MTKDTDLAAASRRKQFAALASVSASTLLTVAKLVAGYFSGSLALISEGAHNALDIGVSATTFFAVRAADKPADDDHPFGHAKIEAIAALAQTGFLFALSITVVYAAAQRLLTHQTEIDANWGAFAAIILSLVVDTVRWRALARVARETKSDAIAADALHFSSDLVGTLLVLIGLAAARFGFVYGDALAAIGVAFFIGVAGYHLGKRTVNALLDSAPTDVVGEVRKVVANTAGVSGVDYLRLRRNGAQILGELGVFVSRTLSIERVAAIKDAIAAALTARWPEMALIIATAPRALDDETILERVLLTAARRRLLVHHVSIQHVGGRISVTLDLEVDGEMALGAAHSVASDFKHALRHEIGDDVEVETHIEPLETRELEGEPAPPEPTAHFVDTLNRLAAAAGALTDIHNVRLRIVDHRCFGIFHCRARPEISVAAAHAAVDALERATRAQMPELHRVIGHAEPVRPQVAF